MTDPTVYRLKPGALGPGRKKVQKIVLPGQTPEGEPILGLLHKRTYDIVAGGRCRRAEIDRKLVPGDLYYGDPMNSTVKHETDHYPWKVATDVVLSGSAHAPGGRPVQSLTISLQVGTHRKEVRVLGDRVCRYRAGADPFFTEPAPVTTMQLRYERAYGGVDIYTDPQMICAYPRNHLGRGFAIGGSKKVIDNLALPNFEDPSDLLTPARLVTGKIPDWERQPMPQGLGWYSKTWHPRAPLGGIMPGDRALAKELKELYAQVVPPAQRKDYEAAQLPDMDFRFFNGASPGLAVPFLSGDEPVRATNLTPEGEISFQLPGEYPRLGLDLGTGMQEPGVVLHTVMVRLEERQVDLVWRSAIPYPGPDWLPKMKHFQELLQ